MKFKNILSFIAPVIVGLIFVVAPTITATPTSVGVGNIVYAQATTTNPATVTSPEDTTATSCGFRTPSACIRMLIVWPFTGLVKLGSVILAIVGALFDVLIDHTIIKFGSTLYSNDIKTAIEATWTAFRDIANILIIGMFTFIAISIILGIEKYGQKRLVANVLIIAVLINFSLLFTKVVIDGSNFTATQFYNAMASLQNASGGPQVANTTDIAGAFMKPMGIGTAGNTADALDKIAGDKGIAVMMSTAILTFIFLLGAAAVLFYGCFILISRAILLLFILITSSLAFASHLIPENKWWGAWWSSLINTAVLAPMLMLLLWATLRVANALHTTGSLGILSTSPQNAGGISVLFSYIIVVGLLFISFKVSSDFASSISGISSINGALAKMTGGAVALSAATSALGLQRTIGSRAMLQEKKYSGDAKRVAGELANLKPTDALYGKKLEQFNELQKKAAEANARSKQEFNLMNTAIGKNISKLSGIGDAGKTAGGGAAGRAKLMADEAAKSAAGLEVSKADAEKQAAELMKTEEKALVTQKETAEKMVESTKAIADEAMKNEDLGSKKEKATQEVQTVRLESQNNSNNHDKEMKELANELAKHPPQAPEAADIQAKITAKNAERKTELDKEGQRIKEAQGKVEEIQKRIDDVTAPYNTAKKEYDSIKKVYDTRVQFHAERLVKNSHANVEESAARNVQHNFPTQSEHSEHVAQMARDTAKKGLSFKKFREKREMEKRADKEIESSAGIVDTGLPPKA